MNHDLQTVAGIDAAISELVACKAEDPKWKRMRLEQLKRWRRELRGEIPPRDPQDCY